MDLKLLAKKAVKGLVKGELTVPGMELTNAERLALIRRRKKEEAETLQNYSLFIYICCLVTIEYKKIGLDIIRKGVTAEMNGKTVYPELTKITPEIALCTLLYCIHTSHQGSGDVYLHSMSALTDSWKLYEETLSLYHEVDEKRLKESGLLEDMGKAGMLDELKK